MTGFVIEVGGGSRTSRPSVFRTFLPGVTEGEMCCVSQLRRRKKASPFHVAFQRHQLRWPSPDNAIRVLNGDLHPRASIEISAARRPKLVGSTARGRPPSPDSPLRTRW